MQGRTRKARPFLAPAHRIVEPGVPPPIELESLTHHRRRHHHTPSES